MNREDKEALFFSLIVLAVGLASVAVLRPVWTFLVAAVLLVFVTYPLYRRIDGVLGRPWLSSGILVTVLLIAVIVPVGVLSGEAVNQSGRVVESLTTVGVERIDLEKVETRVEGVLGREVDIEGRIQESVEEFGRHFTAGLTRVFEAVANFLIGILVMIFTMFYLYREGPLLVDRSREVLPVSEERKELLFGELEDVIWAMVVGHLLTSIVQGAVGGVGFYIFGIGNAAFWGLVMVILAIIPLLGPYVLYLAAAAVIALQGDLVRAAGLAFYGIVLVSLVDNFIRPYFVEHRGDVHPVITFVGVIGGISAFGIMGIFIGPVVLALLVATLRASAGARD